MCCCVLMLIIIVIIALLMITLFIPVHPPHSPPGAENSVALQRVSRHLFGGLRGRRSDDGLRPPAAALQLALPAEHQPGSTPFEHSPDGQLTRLQLHQLRTVALRQQQSLGHSVQREHSQQGGGGKWRKWRPAVYGDAAQSAEAVHGCRRRRRRR